MNETLLYTNMGAVCLIIGGLLSGPISMKLGRKTIIIANEIGIVIMCLILGSLSLVQYY